MCASGYRVVECLSVGIQAIETVDSKHINHAASVCQHILLLSKTHTHTLFQTIYSNPPKGRGSINEFIISTNVHVHV